MDDLGWLQEAGRSVFVWAATTLPWLGLLFAFGALWLGVVGMDEGDAGRDLLLLSIAVSLITGLFIALLMVQ